MSNNNPMIIIDMILVIKQDGDDLRCEGFSNDSDVGFHLYNINIIAMQEAEEGTIIKNFTHNDTKHGF